ncbi:surface-adhesin protein E [Bisgaardia hudsonensis]|uniref:Surface-adhesin protein E n=1 Tax=Bisgaardia hudsonensis TaxID=109472 RepID=A0A4R2N001_9PAST|nr:surface-adhesin E family protein [Bisgaardia hudsonensis]QLB12279.1 hypothetical protein A6A11_00925 [Bisgaardia hudsonensis]TCP12323.1 surface-adhesin protein E [Bisgaardia hudsonensis]
MKKIILFVVTFSLIACSSPKKTPPLSVDLVRPTLIKSGYIKLSREYQDYVDIHSIKIDDKNQHLVHLNLVENLDKGAFVSFDDPNIYAKSIVRQKVLNCESNRLIQKNANQYFMDFWGELPIKGNTKKIVEDSITLKKGTALYAIKQAFCKKLDRVW